jgi:sialidase-1
MRWLFLLSAAAFGQDFETGAVKASDGAKFLRNAQPQVARLGGGRLLAVWDANAKGSADSRVAGAFSGDGGKSWTEPQTLVDDPNMSDGDPNILVDGQKVFVYVTRVRNPNRIDKAWTLVTRSDDNGATWAAPEEIHIPRQYTPGKQHNAIKLFDGSYLMGISWDLWAEKGMAARTEGEMVLASGALLSRDGIRWTLHGNISTFIPKVTPNSTNGLCEPATVQLPDGELLMILRSGGSRHWESRSKDGGVTWSMPQPSSLVGHNTPVAILRLEQTGEVVAVWNNSPINRFPLSAALSADGGKTWSKPRILASGEGGLQASYPGLTQAADGTIVAVWQQQRADGGRDIRWGRFGRNWLITGR